MRRIEIVLVTVFLLGAGPLGAQAQEPEGFRLDFQDVELSVVLSALADAGGFNVVYSGLPSRRVTLRMNQPIPSEQILELLQSIATSNGLSVVRDGALLRIEATGQAAAQLAPADAAAQTEEGVLRLFVYRLKHTRAPQMASTLQAMFGGRGGGPGTRPTAGRTLSRQLREQQVPPVEPREPPQEPRVTVELGEAAEPSLPAELAGEVLIVPDEATNSILVRAQPADWEVLREAIQALDLRPLQVLIEVLVAEVRRTGTFELGVSAQVIAKDFPESGATVTGTLLDTRTAGEFALEVMRFNGVDLDATLSALASNGDVEILSRPVLVAQNNQEAHILIGDERPFIQVFRSLPTDAAVRDQVIQYRDVGTQLTIIPTVNDEGYVNLQVTQQVSNATEETQFGAPIISTREASTQVFVKDGHTVVVGGLIDRQREKSQSGIPLLKDIPLLGLLFGTTQKKTVKAELFIFLTPHVIQSDEDYQRMGEDIREGTELLQEEMGKAMDRRLLPDTIPANR
jgi:general secretion pathway protein D